MKKKELIAVVISLVVVIGFSFLPEGFGLSKNMISAIGLFIGCMTLWLSEALPISISTLLMICFLPMTGLMSFEKAVASFGVNTSLFIMASSGITAAISISLIPEKISEILMDKFKTRPKTLVLSVGLVTALFSAFMSSLAACVLFEGIISPAFKDVKENKTIRKCLMIAIPVCAGVGGFMSPAGTPGNMLILDVLKNHGQIIRFIDWCLVGFPVGLITVFLFLITLIIVNNPKTMKFTEIENKRLSRKDYLIITIVSLVIIAWFISSFIDWLNITTIAIVGLVLMFMPKISILDMKSFSKNVNWDLVITIGSVSVLMTAISGSGIFTVFVKNFFSEFNAQNIILILVLISACICFIRAFIPTTSAVIALFAPALISVSAYSGISLIVTMFLLGFWAASEMLLIFTEPIFLITYKNKCYTETDLLKSGIIPSVVMVFLAPIMIMALCVLFS